MILGAIDPNRQGKELVNDLARATKRLLDGKGEDHAAVWEDRHLALCSIPPRVDPLEEMPQPFMSEDESIVVMFEGKIFNAEEIKKWLGSETRFQTRCTGELLVHLYRKDHEGFLDKVNGKFSFALWDKADQKLILGRDRLGIESMFYFSDGKRLVFGSSLKALLLTGWIDKQLNHEAVLQYLLFNYNPGEETFQKKVYKLPPGHLLISNGAGVSLKKYWTLSFAETWEKSEAQYREEILSLIEDAIRIRLSPGSNPGIFLSGGTDSSTIVSFASRMVKGPIRTFSFRCEGRSYDESYYARLVSDRYKTEHTEIPYGPNQLLLLPKVVEKMDEPFSDIGIEIGTYLLGQEAQGKVSYVLSGEGGDELFAGHPVYIADKVAAFLDRIPKMILQPFLNRLQKIPDSDQKKNLQVKLKRFSYSLSFPPELLSHRWRVYYTPQELQKLCAPGFLEQCEIEKVFDPVLQLNKKANGKDLLSRSLFSDYYTLVDFYLRRLDLLRAFSVDSRLPLLDHRLVEYAAKIPSSMKIRGFSKTKYIYRKVLEGVLPNEILYNRPKLGHSVPMKNWLRENKTGQDMVTDLLSEGFSRGETLFRASSIRRMIEEHTGKVHNHSHRLWGLIVLELWLKSFLDV